MFEKIIEHLRPSEAAELRDSLASFCSERLGEIGSTAEEFNFDALQAAAAFHQAYSRLNTLISDLG